MGAEVQSSIQKKSLHTFCREAAASALENPLGEQGFERDGGSGQQGACSLVTLKEGLSIKSFGLEVHALECGCER